MTGISAEQQARDLLERCGVEDAQSFSAGDVVELANLLAGINRDRAELRRLAAWWRTCSGDKSFRQALDFCAGQLELALDGELRGFETTTVYQGGKTPHWLADGR